ncbi:hypothetical protein D047_0193A, partial [Vibrio parahaemolyticus VPTS-2010_2]
MHKQP